MKKVCFIGGMDKLDIILYCAQIITGANQNENINCLLVDMTIQDKARYIIPSIELSSEKTQKYITTYQGVDIAVGFKTYNELVEAGIIENLDAQSKKYDLVFFNLDSSERFDNIPLEEQDLIYLMTTLDIYSLERSVETFKNYNGYLPVSRVIFGKKLNATHLEYISYLHKGTNVKFSDYIITFPYDNGDTTIIFSNQMARRLNMKPFSQQFKSGLEQLCSTIVPEQDRYIGKYIKVLEKN